MNRTCHTFLTASLVVYLAAVAGVRADTVPQPVPRAAEPFDLADVRLLAGPFQEAMLRDQQYLLSLDIERLLHNFRVNVGLPSQARPLGGWEAPDCELRGHAVGHYLSAVALMYASTGNPEFKRRADALVAGFAECQSAASTAGFHPGYLSAFPESLIDRVEKRQKVWAPWYTLHKIMAGLLDANRHCANPQALTVLNHLADWIQFRVDRLTPAQMQKSLDTEHGGMNEVLANLYAVTGNPNHWRLALAFNHQKVLEPLARGEDHLDSYHANTQIPKIIGVLREYELSEEPADLAIARTFWESVALRRSYVIGGHSDYEHFFPVTEFAKHLGAAAAETCNTYNMLKLTRGLFALEPSAAKMDFYERALYNDILASQDPESEMFTYFMSLKPGHFKVYSTPEDSFWCCVGTGMENHAKYGDTIYFHTATALYVNLFIASELSWKEKGLKLRQETRYPESDTSVLQWDVAAPLRLALKIRHPAWAVSGMTVTVNGEKQPLASVPGSYATLEREWHQGDRVGIQFPMSLHLETLPAVSNQVAVLYGPLVLAGQLGTNNLPSPFAKKQNDLNLLPTPPVPVFVGSPGDVLNGVEPVAGQPLTFRTRNLARPAEVTLVPFYRIHRERYTVYWPVLSPAEWTVRSAELAAQESRRMAEEARVVDTVNPGESQSETDHNFQYGSSQTGDFKSRKWRSAADWFSYELKVVPDAPLQLACTYWGGDGGKREFDVSANGVIIGTEKLDAKKPGKFYEVMYPLAPKVTQGKDKITVKFTAHPGNQAGGIFGMRLLRGEPVAK